MIDIRNTRSHIRCLIHPDRQIRQPVAERARLLLKNWVIYSASLSVPSHCASALIAVEDRTPEISERKNETLVVTVRVVTAYALLALVALGVALSMLYRSPSLSRFAMGIVIGSLVWMIIAEFIYGGTIQYSYLIPLIMAVVFLVGIRSRV